MTWNSQPPVPGPTGALIRPGRLGLGDVATGAWNLYKARFGLFVRLLIMPYVVMFGVFAAAGALALIAVVANRNDPDRALPVVVLVMLVGYIGVLGASLLVYVYQGRTVIAGIDLATGRVEPTPGNLAERTTGMLGRLVVLILIGIAFGFVLTMVVVAFFVFISLAGISVFRDVGAKVPDVGVGLLFVLLFMVAFYALLLWLAVKVTYTIPVMAEEGASGWTALVRSFELTQGAFWRTAGSLIVASLIGMVAMLLPYLIMMASIAGSMQSNGSVSVLGVIGALIGMVTMWAVVVLYGPYQTLFVTLMYLSRRQEVTVPAPAQQYLPPTQYPYPPEPTL